MSMKYLLSRICNERSLLFFGCRAKNKDLYFEDDFSQLTRLNAFSRDSSCKKQYVQEVIEENSQLGTSLFLLHFSVSFSIRENYAGLHHLNRWKIKRYARWREERDKSKRKTSLLWKFHIFLDGDSEKCEHDGRTSNCILENVARPRKDFNKLTFSYREI